MEVEKAIFNSYKLDLRLVDENINLNLRPVVYRDESTTFVEYTAISSKNLLDGELRRQEFVFFLEELMIIYSLKNGIQKHFC